MWKTLKLFLNPFDARYEELSKGPKHLVILRDFSAGLIVAMMAIPLAMGFAMASGLKPEQGIVGGAVAGLVGALFGGSKYQVYGPTAAFIPLIAGLMSAYATPEDPYAGHGFLVLAAVISGVILMALGLSGLGKLAKWVPHSIVVGFTLGIAVTIALSQIGEVLGIGAELEGYLKQSLQDPQASIPGYGFFLKLRVIGEHLGEYRGEALLLALVTFLVTKYLLKISMELVPMACIGGILMWVAANMVKPAEIRQVFAHNWFHVLLMVYTAVAVIVTDFMTGVLTALVLYGLLFKFLDRMPSGETPCEDPPTTAPQLASGVACLSAGGAGK